MNTQANRAALVKSLTGQAAGIYAWPVIGMSLTTIAGANAWVQLVSGVALFGAAFVYYRYRAAKVNAALAVDPQEHRLRYLEPGRVVTLVATANAAQGAGQAVGTLIEKLVNVREIKLILGTSDVTQQARLIEQLRDHAEAHGRQVTVALDPIAISPWEVRQDDQEQLIRRLRDIAVDDGTWIDVTGGTAAMSLAVSRAAEAVGHHLCYTATDRTKNPTVYFGVVDISHPQSGATDT